MRAFHVERAHRRAGVFERIAGGPRRADAADQRQDHVLRGDAHGERAAELGPHRAGPALRQMVCVASTCSISVAPMPNAIAPSAAVGAGVAVAAHHRGAGQRQAELGRRHVHDALALLADVVQAHAGRARLLAQQGDQFVGPRRVAPGAARRGLDQMVRGGEGQLGIAHGQTAPQHPGDGLAAAQVVQQVPVDVQQVDAGRERFHHMLVPDLVEQRERAHCAYFFSNSQTSSKPTSSCSFFMS